MLRFGERESGISLQSVESYVRTGNHINLTFTLYELCGIGLLPPPDFVYAPIALLPAGNYQVTVSVDRAPAIAPQTLSFTVAGASTSIPLLSPASTLLMLTSLLMVGGWVLRKRRRAS